MKVSKVREHLMHLEPDEEIVINWWTRDWAFGGDVSEQTWNEVVRIIDGETEQEIRMIADKILTLIEEVA